MMARKNFKTILKFVLHPFSIGGGAAMRIELPYKLYIYVRCVENCVGTILHNCTAKTHVSVKKSGQPEKLK
jgi:hypothetical protein